MRRRTHLANVATAQLNTLLTTAGAFVVTPIVLGALGDSAYGGWLLLNSFVAYLRFLDLGSTAGTVKYGAGAYERGDDVSLRATLDTSAAIFTAAAVVAAVGTLGLMALLPRLYPGIASHHLVAILLLGASMAIEMLFRPFVAAVRIRLLYWLYDVIEIVTFLVFKFGLVIYFARTRGLTYELLATLTVLDTLIRLGLVGIASAVALPAIRHINPMNMRRDMIRKIGAMGVAVTIIMVADIVRFQLDAGVIGYFMPESPQSIAVFGIGARVANMAAAVIGVIAGVLFPRFAALAETGDHEATQDLLERTSFYTGLACAFVLVNLVVLGPQFLSVWLNKPWTGQSATVMLILIPGYWLGLLCGASAAQLAGAGRLRRLTVYVVVEAIINLVLSAALVRPFGIIGVALGTAIPLLVFQIVVFPWLLRQETGMPVAQYWRMHARGLWLGAVYLVLVSVLALNPAQRLSNLVMRGTVSTAVFAVLTLLMVPDVRTPIARRLARWRTGDV